MRRRGQSQAVQPRGAVFGHTVIPQTCQERNQIHIEVVPRPPHACSDRMCAEVLSEDVLKLTPVQTFPPPNVVPPEHAKMVLSKTQFQLQMQFQEALYACSTPMKLIRYNSSKYIHSRKKTEGIDLDYEVDIDPTLKIDSNGEALDILNPGLNAMKELQGLSALPVIDTVNSPSVDEKESIDAAEKKKMRQTQLFMDNIDNPRLPIMQAYHPGFSYDGGFEYLIRGKDKESSWIKNPDITNLGYRAALRFLMEIKSFHIEYGTGPREPFFLEFALYDCSNLLKVSESFWFFTDESKSLQSAKVVENSSSPYAESNQVIFSLSEVHESIFLACKVYRVLQGDLKAGYDVYGSKNPKGVEEDLEFFIQRFPKFKQLFLWSAIPLVDENKRFTADPSFMREFFAPLSPNEPFDIMALRSSIKERLRNPKGLWSVPVKIDLSFRKLSKDRSEAIVDVTQKGEYVVIDPLVRRLMPAKSAKEGPVEENDGKSNELKEISEVVNESLVSVSNRKLQVARELLEFPPSSRLWPIEEHYHVLYVYPECVSIPDCRNVCVSIQIRDSDDIVEQDGLPLIFGTPPWPTFTNEAYSEVTYHSKLPTFESEIKVIICSKFLFKTVSRLNCLSIYLHVHIFSLLF
jgi:hypothetical protein